MRTSYTERAARCQAAPPNAPRRAGAQSREFSPVRYVVDMRASAAKNLFALGVEGRLPMIEREERDGVVILRLAHKKASALDLELLQALERALADASDAEAVVLTGTGAIFSAGVDLFRVLDGGADYVARFLPALKH